MIDILREHWLYLLIGAYPRGPIGGLAMTIVIAVLSLVLVFPLAVLVALARTGGLRWLVKISIGFVYIVRGVPLLMLIFWLFYGFPVLFGFPLPPFLTIVLAIVLYQTAYLSEVIRAGIEGLPAGQVEAARSLGMRYFPVVWKVVLPQALYNVIPGMLNQLTAIFKETSLGYLVAVPELSYSAYLLNNMLMTKPFQIFGIIAIIYFTLCFSLSRAARYMEQRVLRRRAGAITGIDAPASAS
jgi:polar amino acid transport system permease protein